MSTSRTLLWSSALLGSLLFVFGTATGCGDDEPNEEPQNDAGGSSSGGSSSSSGGNDGGGSSSGGSSSGGSDAGDDGGTPIPIPTGATLKWTSKGGFGPEVGDASTCSPSDDTFTYDIGTKALTWKLCRALAGVPEEAPAYAFEEGNATVTEAQDAAIHAALEGVVPNAETGCGADKPNVELQVVEPNDATTTYVDQFYHCVDDGKNYVDGLDALGNAFDEAVPESPVD